MTTVFRDRLLKLSDQLSRNSGRQRSPRVNAPLPHFPAHIWELFPANNANVGILGFNRRAGAKVARDNLRFRQGSFLTTVFAHEEAPQ